MIHRKTFRKLGRNSAHRRALFRNMATSLILHQKIETTLCKAKELRRVVEKMVTLGKRGSLHARRQAMAFLQPINRTESGFSEKRTAVHQLFEEIAPRFQERNGGYTRITKTGSRKGDRAPMAVIEFVTEPLEKKGDRRRRRVIKPLAGAETGVESSAAVPLSDVESAIAS